MPASNGSRATSLETGERSQGLPRSTITRRLRRLCVCTEWRQHPFPTDFCLVNPLDLASGEPAVRPRPRLAPFGWRSREKSQQRPTTNPSTRTCAARDHHHPSDPISIGRRNRCSSLCFAPGSLAKSSRLANADCGQVNSTSADRTPPDLAGRKGFQLQRRAHGLSSQHFIFHFRAYARSSQPPLSFWPDRSSCQLRPNNTTTSEGILERGAELKTTP
jgi:hypothetical protein